MFGQAETLDEIWVTDGTGITTEVMITTPEGQYLASYQGQQEILQSQVEAGSSFLDIFKTILDIATPVVTSVIKAGQVPVPTTITKTATGLSVQPLTAGISSSSLLLIAAGLGGFMILRKRGKKRR